MIGQKIRYRPIAALKPSIPDVPAPATVAILLQVAARVFAHQLRKLGCVMPLHPSTVVLAGPSDACRSLFFLLTGCFTVSNAESQLLRLNAVHARVGRSCSRQALHRLRTRESRRLVEAAVRRRPAALHRGLPSKLLDERHIPSLNLLGLVYPNCRVRGVAPCSPHGRGGDRLIVPPGKNATWCLLANDCVHKVGKGYSGLSGRRAEDSARCESCPHRQTACARMDFAQGKFG